MVENVVIGLLNCIVLPFRPKDICHKDTKTRRREEGQKLIVGFVPLCLCGEFITACSGSRLDQIPSRVVAIKK